MADRTGDGSPGQGTILCPVQDLWEAAQQVYKDYPELLKAAKTILLGDD